MEVRTSEDPQWRSSPSRRPRRSRSPAHEVSHGGNPMTWLQRTSDLLRFGTAGPGSPAPADSDPLGTAPAPGHRQPAASSAGPPGRGDFEVGQVLDGQFGPYEVVDVMFGGVGVVYVVRRGGEGFLSALKTFQARYLWSAEDRDRFEREALTWMRLDRHPNVVAAHWLEHIEGFPCLMLDYVDGIDLSELLAQDPLHGGTALGLALQFCDGMDYAHRKLGIVQRDIKPANCLIAKGGVLKVTDFGLARGFGRAGDVSGAHTATYETTTAGTIPYMAPEQFEAGAALDTRTDIHAFGVMLYEMLTGDRPASGLVARAHIEAGAAG